MSEVHHWHGRIIEAVNGDERSMHRIALDADIAPPNLHRYMKTGGRGLGTDAVLRLMATVGLVLVHPQH